MTVRVPRQARMIGGHALVWGIPYPSVGAVTPVFERVEADAFDYWLTAFGNGLAGDIPLEAADYRGHLARVGRCLAFDVTGHGLYVVAELDATPVGDALLHAADAGAVKPSVNVLNFGSGIAPGEDVDGIPVLRVDRAWIRSVVLTEAPRCRGTVIDEVAGRTAEWLAAIQQEAA